MATFGWVRLRFGRATVPAVSIFSSDGPSGERVVLFHCVSRRLNIEARVCFQLQLLCKTVPVVLVPLSAPRRTVPIAPVSGSGPFLHHPIKWNSKACRRSDVESVITVTFASRHVDIAVQCSTYGRRLHEKSCLRVFRSSAAGFGRM